jgi:hypothetical protein
VVLWELPWWAVDEDIGGNNYNEWNTKRRAVKGNE